MLWYIIFAGLYVAVLALILLFLAGATKLSDAAEAKNKMMPPRTPRMNRGRVKKRYRDAA